MSAPTLSVIIPAYNRQASTIQAIRSVLDQGFEDLEIIVVDDASVPEFSLTPELKSDSRIIVMRHGLNRGASAARNTGTMAARGVWAAFLDSDDRWLPGTLLPRLELARREKAANPLTVWVAGFKLVRANGFSEIRIPKSSSDPLAFASGCWFSPGSTALFQREPILARVGGQDEWLRRLEDIDWFLRIALAGGGIKTSTVVAAEIMVGSKPPIADLVSAQAVMQKKFSGSIADVRLRAAVMRRLDAIFALERASTYWYTGHRPRALRELLRSWCLVPRLHLSVEAFWERAGHVGHAVSKARES